MELIDLGETKDFTERLQQDWLNACLAADIPAVTRDTAARLMAVLYVHGGGHEEMVMNRKFTNEMRYIQRRYGIEGGQRPDAEVVSLIQHYVRELMEQREQCNARIDIAESRQKSSEAQLEQYEGEHGNGSDTDADGSKVMDSAPEWAVRLFRDRYGIKLRH